MRCKQVHSWVVVEDWKVHSWAVGGKEGVLEAMQWVLFYLLFIFIYLSLINSSEFYPVDTLDREWLMIWKCLAVVIHPTYLV